MSLNETHDGQLLADLAAASSQSSFEELVRRHGNMVYNECRRLLADAHDAEDATQAVFLVLWKKAKSVRARHSIAAWLHRVARNVCRNAQRARTVRKIRERQAAEMNPRASNVDAAADSIQNVLDDDLDRLPEKYRLPLILFHLEGRSIEEIAALMGLKSATIGTRLSRAREMLRSRMLRRGIVVTMPALDTALAADAGAAVLPATFAATTAQCATLYAAGSVSATGALSAQTAALANGAMHMLAVAKLKLAVATIVAASLVCGGAVAVVKVIEASGSASQQQTNLTPLPHRAPISAVDGPGKASPVPSVVALARPPETDEAKAKLAEIIRQVKENEQKYRDLETVVRIKKHIAKPGSSNVEARVGKTLEGRPENTAKSEFTEFVEKRRTIWQGELLYFEDQEEGGPGKNDPPTLRRLSAYDGEKTRSIEFGNVVNIHLGLQESPYVYPPHNWALLDLQVSFPLSVFLEGTDAIAKHPKAHHSGREMGAVFDFPRVESSLDGEDTILGLKCQKIRVDRWYRSNGRPLTHLLWLAPERNFLCLKEQTLLAWQELPYAETVVEELREIAPGLWLPARVTTRNFDSDALKQGELVERSPADTLVLEQAIVKPGHAVSFFRDAEIPAELPVYTIRDGRLADSRGFENREPPPESAERLSALIANIQSNEKLYTDLEVELENRYRDFEDSTFGRFAGQIIGKTEHEHCVQRNEMHWSTVQESSTTASGQSLPRTVTETFDGTWSRSLRVEPSRRTDESGVSQFASIRKGRRRDALVPRPHMFAFRHDWDRQRQPLSRFLTSTWSDEVNGYRQSVDWMGEDERNGLRCDVVRISGFPSPGQPANAFRLVWLAKDRNDLAIHNECYEPTKSPGLPTGITTVDDLREISPGVWCPFRLARIVFDKMAVAGLSNGWMTVNYRDDCVIHRANLNPDAPPERFAGPDVPQGAKVFVQHESGRELGEFQQPETGPVNISDVQ